MELPVRLDLIDLLACPTCRVAVVRADSALRCTVCGTVFPIIDGVPIMTADGSVPAVAHEGDLATTDSYVPWIYRLVMQSLLDDQVVLEMGSGDRKNSDPAVIRMDIRLTPYVDVVADAHALPFLPGSIDFIFSLALFEHLRQPWLAAEEQQRVLKDGGYAYNDCAWLFAYHGYPHHYFNASVQGMQQLFSGLRELRSGVAPYQMPSYGLMMNLSTYLRNVKADGIYRSGEILAMLTAPLHEELIDLDAGFTEEAAARVAACTYFFGVKQDTDTSSCLPVPVMQAWHDSPALQARFPDPLNLGTVDNLLLWTRAEGAATYPEIREHLEAVVPFAKHRDREPYDRTYLRELPLVEPVFGSIYRYPEVAPERRVSPFVHPAPPPSYLHQALAIMARDAEPEPEPEAVDIVVGTDELLEEIDEVLDEVLDRPIVPAWRPTRGARLWRSLVDEGTMVTTRKVARRLSSRSR